MHYLVNCFGLWYGLREFSCSIPIKKKNESPLLAGRPELYSLLNLKRTVLKYERVDTNALIYPTPAGQTGWSTLEPKAVDISWRTDGQNTLAVGKSWNHYTGVKIRLHTKVLTIIKRIAVQKLSTEGGWKIVKWTDERMKLLALAWLSQMLA